LRQTQSASRPLLTNTLGHSSALVDSGEIDGARLLRIMQTRNYCGGDCELK
jgi:hypothetical protein